MTRDTGLTYEQAVDAFVGRRIVAVHYYEIAYESGEPAWRRYGERFDSLDFGLNLTLDDGRVYGFIWDQASSPYGVSVEAGPLKDILERAAIWDATSNSHWSTLLGKEIKCVVFYWLTDIPGQSPYLFPQDVELAFETGEQVFISASMYREEDDAFDWEIDEITVIFDDEVARRYHVGPYMPPGLGFHTPTR